MIFLNPHYSGNKYGYIIQCTDYKKDPGTGEVVEVHCTYDPDTRSGGPNSSKKVKGTLSWVTVKHSLPVEVRLYDRLFNDQNPDGNKDKDFKEFLNPDSLQVLTHSRVEPSLRNAQPMDHYQFERQGYFYLDPDSSSETLIFNRTVTLRDAWARIQQKK